VGWDWGGGGEGGSPPIPLAFSRTHSLSFSLNASNENLYKKLDTFGDVFQTIRSNYVTTINEEEVIEAAINGMLQSLDPHSSYMNLDNYKDMQEETNGKFGGLGIEVTMENGFVKIISPIDGTPGAKAGIQPGDYITHIDDESIFGLSLTEAVDQLRGLVGTTVKLKIARENEEEPLDISITRAIITVEAVKYRKEGNVGYIKLISFSEQADRGIKKAIKALTTEIGKDKIIGFVLDLRNNPGGLLGQSIEVTDNFLTSGEIVSTKGKDKSNIGSFKASRGDMTNGKPIIVLINRGSASASEIVAGALQDHKRAIIVGEQSYGKGSVQTIFPLNDRSAIRLTTALYYTPSGDSIHKIGITPDIEVTRSKKSDPADNTDNQLDYALDLLIKDSIIN
jgi:carboxyl-terminal processing protease